MTREDPLLRVRLPDDLKARVKTVAAENHRSMNAEIVARLEASFEKDAMNGVPDFVTPFRLEDLEKEVTDIKQRLEKLERRK